MLRYLTCTAIFLLMPLTSTAYAQGLDAPATAQPPPAAQPAQLEVPTPPTGFTRTFGFGMSHGAGVAAASINDFSGGSTLSLNFALLLPTFEAIIFLDEDDLALEISVPIVNIIAVSAIAQAFIWNTQVFLTFHVGDDVRFVGGPGLGFSVVAVGGLAGFSLRLPATLGVEVLTPARSVGFRVVTRPFVEVAFVSSSDPLVGGGALLELAFNFYATSL